MTQLRADPPAPDVAGQLAAGLAALDAQDWALALDHAQRLLASPLGAEQHAQALLLLARAHWIRGTVAEVQQPALQAARLAQQAGEVRLQIRALSWASMALTELGLADEALPLALRAITLAEMPGLHDQLPPALSCAAHARARQGDLERAEQLHMRALSLARESGQPVMVKQAYTNLLLSSRLVYEELLARQGADAATLALGAARRQLGHAASLARDDRLEPGQRVALILALGHLRILSDELPEAEALLSEGIAICEQNHSSYYLHAGRHSLGLLRIHQGRADEGLRLLRELLQPAHGHVPVFVQQLETLRLLVQTLHGLARADEAAAHEQQLAEALATRDAMRQQARLSLSRP